MSSPLDDRIRSVLDRVRVAVSGQLEADLTASAADIARAVAEEQRRALVEATDRASEIRRDAEEQMSNLRAQLAREREEFERGAALEMAAVERTLVDVRTQLETAQQNLTRAESVRDSLEGERDALTRERDELSHARDGLTQERDALTQQRDLLTQQRDSLTQERDVLAQQRLSLERQRDDLEQQLHAVEERRHALEAERTSLEQQRDSLELERNALEQQLDQLRQGARLAAAFRSLDEATSLGDILEHLARLACQESGRTAVFLLNGNRLRGWRAVGFDANNPIVGSDFEPGDIDVIGKAARLGKGQQHRNGDATRLPPFASSQGPRDAVAVPVQVGGSVIAVLYADAARTDSPEEPGWLRLVDAMTRHAGRALEAMTVRQAAAMWTSGRWGVLPRGGDRSPVGME